MKNTKISYRVTTKGGGWSKFNSIESAIEYNKILYDKGIKHPILNIIKITEESLPQEEIDKINKEIQKQINKMKVKNYDQAFDELIKCLLKNTKEAKCVTALKD